MVKRYIEGEPIKGTRIEIPVHYDAWMQGARFGTVTSGVRNGGAGRSDYVFVRLDHPQVRRALKLWRPDWSFAAIVESSR